MSRGTRAQGKIRERESERDARQRLLRDIRDARACDWNFINWPLHNSWEGRRETESRACFLSFFLRECDFAVLFFQEERVLFWLGSELLLPVGFYATFAAEWVVYWGGMLSVSLGFQTGSRWCGFCWWILFFGYSVFFKERWCTILLDSVIFHVSTWDICILLWDYSSNLNGLESIVHERNLVFTQRLFHGIMGHLKSSFHDFNILRLEYLTLCWTKLDIEMILGKLLGKTKHWF